MEKYPGSTASGWFCKVLVSVEQETWARYLCWKEALLKKSLYSGVCHACLLNLRKGQEWIPAGCDSFRPYSIPLSDQMINSQLASFPKGGTTTAKAPGKKWIFQGLTARITNKVVQTNLLPDPWLFLPVWCWRDWDKTAQSWADLQWIKPAAFHSTARW